jgi:serine/threonine protein kinase
MNEQHRLALVKAIGRADDDATGVLASKTRFRDDHSHGEFLKHPHILNMRGWGTIPRGALFLVTDFIPGRNLAEWCRMQRPSVTRIAEVVSRVAGAVAVAHAAGVLHCDLKPANVLMRQDGQVVLCDFGLARHATDPEDVPRGGTAGFLCPEQISDAFGPMTARSDVYGLGGLLYALLTGRPPMTGRDLPETLANVLSAAAPEAPRRLGAISTATLDAITLRCLEKDPNRRYANAHYVEAQLTQAVTA